jgi:hypothetical protein
MMIDRIYKIYSGFTRKDIVNPVGNPVNPVNKNGSSKAAQGIDEACANKNRLFLCFLCRVERI